MSKKIAVIGAGISGMTCAYTLKKAGHDVVVYEKEAYVGGRMSTRTKDDLPFDIGADHLGNAYFAMQDLCKELHVDWVPMIKPQYAIYRNGRLHNHYKTVRKSEQIKLAVYTMFLRNNTDFFNLDTAIRFNTNSAYEYVRKIIGKESADYLADGVVNGYQFHSSKEVSKAIFVAYWQSIKRDNWLLHKTQGGMIALSNAMAEQVDVHLNTPVHAVIPGDRIRVRTEHGEQIFDEVVLATTADITHKILQHQSQQVSELLTKTEYSYSISLAYKIDVEKMPEESNFFTPYIESKAIASYTNQLMKGEEFISNGKTLLAVWLHEQYAKEIFNKSDEEILELSRQELANVCPWLDSIDSLEAYDLYKWTHAMPKFSQGQLERVKAFHDSEQGQEGIWLCGDYLNAPWTEGALRSGLRVANLINDKAASH